MYDGVAYVPQFDLFLDGTAEMNGTTELPAMDQGTVTLVVGPESADFRRTPVLPAASSVREQRLRIELDADTSAQVAGEEVVRGDAASYYRRTYQAEGRRQERLQRELARRFPGIEVSAQNFEHLDEFEESPEFTWRARIPQFAERTAEGLSVAPSSMSNLTRALAPSPRRRSALELGPPNRRVETRVVVLPAGAGATLPSGGRVESEFGTLALSARRQGNNVEVSTEWTQTAHRVSADDYPAFRRFVQDVDQLLEQRLTVQLAGQNGANR